MFLFLVLMKQGNKIGLRPYKERMERPIFGKCRKNLCFILYVYFLSWFLLLYIFYTILTIDYRIITLFNHNFSNIVDIQKSISINTNNLVHEETQESRKRFREANGLINQKNPINVVQDGYEIIDQNPILHESQSSIRDSSIFEKKDESEGQDDNDDPCAGQYIYVHNLPPRFNFDLLANCRTLSNWTNMCEFSSNMGLGPILPNTEKVFSNRGWFATNQFMLEVIFHNRMKQYNCLTNDSSIATAIFVPYYAGLDVSRFLWGFSAAVRDASAFDLVNWLKAQPQWKIMQGKDHFMVAGRITWDFRREDDGMSDDWGSRLLLLLELKNMTALVIEKSPWNNNDFAIPYPTYFHPSNDDEVFKWQSRMKRLKRRFLFSFIGAPRPDQKDSIRGEIIDQCRASRRKCRMLECSIRESRCHKPIFVMKMFQNSVFCLQPPGDSYTRRSTFDSILAGCIPVFFHPGSAYIQYLWHIPKDYTRYSVFISGMNIKDKKVSIEKVLQRIPKAKVVAMKKEVIRLIPKVIYADPRDRLETLEDAFDVTVRSVVQKVEKLKLGLKQGFKFGTEVPENMTWKYSLFENLDAHEWDFFFSKIY